VLAGEGEAAALEVLLLVEDQSGGSPPYLPELHLQVVAEYGVHPSLFCFRASRCPGCILVPAGMVRTGTLVAIEGPFSSGIGGWRASVVMLILQVSESGGYG
jgi:hypothetical protein